MSKNKTETFWNIHVMEYHSETEFKVQKQNYTFKYTFQETKEIQDSEHL